MMRNVIIVVLACAVFECNGHLGKLTDILSGAHKHVHDTVHGVANTVLGGFNFQGQFHAGHIPQMPRPNSGKPQEETVIVVVDERPGNNYGYGQNLPNQGTGHYNAMNNRPPPNQYGQNNYGQDRPWHNQNGPNYNQGNPQGPYGHHHQQQEYPNNGNQNGYGQNQYGHQNQYGQQNNYNRPEQPTQGYYPNNDYNRPSNPQYEQGNQNNGYGNNHNHEYNNPNPEHTNNGNSGYADKPNQEYTNNQNNGYGNNHHHEYNNPNPDHTNNGNNGYADKPNHEYTNNQNNGFTNQNNFGQTTPSTTVETRPTFGSINENNDHTEKPHQNDKTTPKSDEPLFIPLHPNEYVYGGDKINVTAPKRETDENKASDDNDKDFPIDIRFQDN